MTTNSELSDREKQVVKALVDGWAKEGNFLLPGNLSYSDVFALCIRLEVAIPTEFIELLASFERR